MKISSVEEIMVMMIPQHESDKCVEVGLRQVGSLDVLGRIVLAGASGATVV